MWGATRRTCRGYHARSRTSDDIRATVKADRTSFQHGWRCSDQRRHRATGRDHVATVSRHACSVYASWCILMHNPWSRSLPTKGCVCLWSTADESAYLSYPQHDGPLNDASTRAQMRRDRDARASRTTDGEPASGEVKRGTVQQSESTERSLGPSRPPSDSPRVHARRTPTNTTLPHCIATSTAR